MHAPPPPPSGPPPPPAPPLEDAEPSRDSASAPSPVRVSRLSTRGSVVLDAVKGVPRTFARRASHVYDAASAIAGAINPGVDAVGFDVLGIHTQPSKTDARPRMHSQASAFEDEDIFEVDVVGEGGDLTPLIAGHGLTSPVLRDAVERGEADWAAEVLLLTHEPLRRDMLEMQRALQAQYFGNLPESWRVRAFFRFFGSWCSLVSQQHAVEVAVHYDWLIAPTGKMEGEHRTELLSYHRAIELELLAISRMEKRVIDELREAADWTTSEPWSEAAQTLRDRLQALCAQIRMHLATQESLLPDLLRDHWGRVAPPQLVTRALQAAKKAEAQGAKGSEKAKLLGWILHYLQRRDPERAKYFVSFLPMMKRISLAMKGGSSHAKLLAHLRCIVDDEQPREDEASRTLTHTEGDTSDRASVSVATSDGSAHEKQRRAGMVNAVLAAANARRMDVPLNDVNTTRLLAESREPLHTFKADGKWAERADKVPDGLFKKIGIEKPQTPRRL